jgi:hypothetical protein
MSLYSALHRGPLAEACYNAAMAAMQARKLTLTLLDVPLAVCRLAPDDPGPEWALSGPFYSVTRTPHELSVICAQSSVPDGVQHDAGWRCLSVVGQLDFEQIGVFASLAGPLAAAGISIFPIATYDTDHVLVKEIDLLRAVNVLVEAGHQLQV